MNDKMTLSKRNFNEARKELLYARKLFSYAIEYLSDDHYSYVISRTFTAIDYATKAALALGDIEEVSCGHLCDMEGTFYHYHAKRFAGSAAENMAVYLDKSHSGFFLLKVKMFNEPLLREMSKGGAVVFTEEEAEGLINDTDEFLNVVFDYLLKNENLTV